MSRQHWAWALIGKPWREGLDGPDGFDCRGLVRHVWLTQRGIEVPALQRGLCAAEVLDAANAGGWQCVGQGPRAAAQELDIVTMNSRQGLHVGVMVRADLRLGVLHAVGHRDEETGREEGSVIYTPSLGDLASLGFGHIKLWRKTS
jgi:cell wall-associated NlpC family hydrolase